MGAVKHNTSRRVATTLTPEQMERVRAERERIAKTTGCRPSLSKVVAAAVERGISQSAN